MNVRLSSKVVFLYIGSDSDPEHLFAELIEIEGREYESDSIVENALKYLRFLRSKGLV